MGMKITDIRLLLGIPRIYSLFQRAVRGESDRFFVTNHVRPVEGDKILDIGCGPGDILKYMPAVDYVGFDADPRSIDAATRRYGDKGRFFCDKVTADSVKEVAHFDIVLAVAILHHLSDREAFDLFGLAWRVLKPGGRLVSWDPCYTERQSAFSRYLMSRDRGRFVRDKEGYERLARDVFSRVDSWVHMDLLRLPLPSIITECFRGAG
jgi:SAM-dependent methyltransferase